MESIFWKGVVSNFMPFARPLDSNSWNDAEGPWRRRGWLDLQLLTIFP